MVGYLGKLNVMKKKKMYSIKGHVVRNVYSRG